MRDERAVPFAPPQWLTPSGVFASSLVLLPLAHFWSDGVPFLPTSGVRAGIDCAVAGAAGFVTTRRGLWFSAWVDPFARCAVCGVVVAFATWVGCVIAQPAWPPVGVPEVAAFGIVGIVKPGVLVAMSRKAAEGTHEDVDRAMVRAGTFWFVIGLLIFLAAAFPGTADGRSDLSWAGVTIASVALVLTVTGRGRLRGRRKFADRVSLGLVPGWHVTPRREGDVGLPILFVGVAREMVLRRHRRDRGYRSDAGDEAVAVFR